MRRALYTAVVLITLGVTSASAVDPDAVREAVRPVQESKSDKAPTPTPAQQAAALSDAFKKFATTHMLMWRTSSSGVTMIMGQFSSRDHCVAAQKLLRRQVVRIGWGRAECLEIMLP